MTFLLLRSDLALLLRNRLSRLLLLWGLALLLLRSDLTLLLLLRNLLPRLLLRSNLALLLRLRSLLALLLRSGLIAHRHLGRNLDVAIGGERLADGDIGRASVIGIGKLCAIGAGSLLVLELGTHGRGMRLTQGSQFGGPGSHLDSTRSAVEADAGAAATNRAVVDVVHDVYVDVVNRAVVVEVAAAPVAALVAEADVAKAVVDAAVVADMPAPVAAIEAVAMVVVAPVAGGPECALVGSLDPGAGNPVVTHGSPGPIARGPDIVVAGILGLIVVGQRRRRLRGVVGRLLAVTGIVGRLILRLGIGVPLIGRRRGLLLAGSGARRILLIRRGLLVPRCVVGSLGQIRIGRV